jgi:hypothetical protein
VVFFHNKSTVGRRKLAQDCGGGAGAGAGAGGRGTYCALRCDMETICGKSMTVTVWSSSTIRLNSLKSE